MNGTVFEFKFAIGDAEKMGVISNPPLLTVVNFFSPTKSLIVNRRTHEKEKYTCRALPVDRNLVGAPDRRRAEVEEKMVRERVG